MTARRVLVLGLTVLIALTLAACGDGDEPDECADPQPADMVRLEDFAFDPDCLTAASGAAISLENVGETPHTFTVEGTDVSFQVQAGESAEGSLSGVEPGTYSVICTFHPQMTATLTVEGQ